MKRPATITVAAEDGAPLWTGTLTDFFRSNATYDAVDRALICDELRDGPVQEGGGASPIFTLEIAPPMLLRRQAV